MLFIFLQNEHVILYKKKTSNGLCNVKVLTAFIAGFLAERHGIVVIATNSLSVYRIRTL